jgi:hypothetical protein
MLMSYLILTGLIMVGSEPADYDPIAELSALGSALAELDQEAGGSIRAKKAVDLDRTTRLKDVKNLQAKVVKVKKGAFPLVALVVKITKSAKEGAGKELKKNTQITIIPKYQKASDGAVDLAQAETLLNAGAYFLLPGDKIMLRVAKTRGALLEAEYLERK